MRPSNTAIKHHTCCSVVRHCLKMYLGFIADVADNIYPSKEELCHFPDTSSVPTGCIQRPLLTSVDWMNPNLKSQLTQFLHVITRHC